MIFQEVSTLTQPLACQNDICSTISAHCTHFAIVRGLHILHSLGSNFLQGIRTVAFESTFNQPNKMLVDGDPDKPDVQRTF